MNLTTEEKLIVEVCRVNKRVSRKEIYKKWVIGKLHIAFNWQSKKNFWGRFGGGWNWNLGFQAGGNTIIFNLLICSLSFYLKKD
jgi:hypothetical protein